MHVTQSYLRQELADAWQGKDVFSVVAQLQGDVFRDKERRQTLRFEYAGKSYFAKVHNGIGWLEIIKNLLQFRLPVVSAKNEWQAVQFLERHDIDTMTLAGYGEQGINPAAIKSFVITDELTETISLENLGEQWQAAPPSFKTKIKLIEKLATISRVMHENGMNHRDFYLCHFLLDKSFAQTNIMTDDTKLFLIDLHRVQLRKSTPNRWKVKDLGSLHYSALKVPLTQRDIYRFIKTYNGKSLRDNLKEDRSFWQQVATRTQKLTQRERLV